MACLTHLNCLVHAQNQLYIISLENKNKTRQDKTKSPGGFQFVSEPNSESGANCVLQSLKQLNPPKKVSPEMLNRDSISCPTTLSDRMGNFLVRIVIDLFKLSAGD